MLIERAVQQSTIPNRPVNWWNPVRKALVLTVALRLFYSLAAAAYSPFLRIDPNQIRVTGFPETLMSRDLHPVLYALIGVWQRWDTVWYLQIASHGYAGAAQTVFYPLFRFPRLQHFSCSGVRSCFLNSTSIPQRHCVR